MIGFYATCFLFVIVILGTLLKVVTGFNLLKLLRYLVASSCSSSPPPPPRPRCRG